MIKVIRNEKGAVLAFTAVSLIAIFGMAGLAIDGARAYVTRAQLSRAVDAAALGGARSLRLGQTVAEQRIRSLAAANGVNPADPAVSLSYDFQTNEDGESTVTVQASRVMPTTFMRVLGRDQVDVGSQAVAAVPPLDIVLVLDTSGSLGHQHAWDDLQRASKDFLDYFDESIDQMGLVSFQIRGADRHLIDQPFKTVIRRSIDNMRSDGDTNTGEGFRLAKEQFDRAPIRDSSTLVIVFFTDGRPTAFRDMIGGEDRVMAVCTTPCGIRGVWDDPDGLSPDHLATNPDACTGNPNPSWCMGFSEPEARDEARASGLERADEAREEGIYVYTIGLGNPGASDPLLVPDHAYMRQLANEDGIEDSGQPEGQYHFAPSAAELDDVFQAVAQDILVRLAQ